MGEVQVGKWHVNRSHKNVVHADSLLGHLDFLTTDEVAWVVVASLEATFSANVSIIFKRGAVVIGIVIQRIEQVNVITDDWELSDVSAVKLTLCDELAHAIVEDRVGVELLKRCA